MGKIASICIFISCFVFLAQAQEEPNSPTSPATSSLSSTGEAAKKFLSYLPNGETRKGLEEYVSIIGAEKFKGDGSLVMANTGMAAYFTEKFTDPKNSCVRDAARSFYEDVAEQLKSKTPQQPGCINTGDGVFTEGKGSVYSNTSACPSAGRANLHSVAGQGPYKNLQPGWLWQLALKHSKGDPNSAMFLIGMCGHDDTSQGTYAYEDSSPQGLDELRQQCLFNKNIKSKLDSEIKDLAKNYDINQEKIYSLSAQSNKYTMEIKALENQKSVQRLMDCPSESSGFYAPQSLGTTADIPAGIKQEVQKIQGDIGGAQNIPAKYYHVYGSAFMACQLIQHGMSLKKTELVQKQAARLYRGIRMCSSTQDFSSEIKTFEAEMAPLSKKYKMTDPVKLALAVAKQIRTGKIKCDGEGGFEKAPPECGYISNYSIPAYLLTSTEFEISDESIAKKVANRFANADAAALYKKWYFGGGTVAGNKLPCSDIRVWGPSDLLEPTKSFFGKLSKPEGWSNERFKKASQKLATWDVDFKWTIAQHEAGAQFAGQTCKKREPNEKPLAGICPGGPPDGKTKWSPSTGDQPDHHSSSTEGIR
ncbi:hypothetical protein [Bdellovibrio svalbardensis]|uniref:hypothetical protein n=1 Tax=Bdellovibrio svalbardensis TaxID=2972972 RepID=UPI00240783F3|nr:hypothetical protein [Bdellovibrio svalbardensis]